MCVHASRVSSRAGERHRVQEDHHHRTKPFEVLRQKRRLPRLARHLGDLKGILRSVSSDFLMGLLDQTAMPLGRLVVALASIHALPGHKIRTLHTMNLV
jgi:hypothetical protein